jgi:hypothetical protein
MSVQNVLGISARLNGVGRLSVNHAKPAAERANSSITSSFLLLCACVRVSRSTAHC